MLRGPDCPERRFLVAELRPRATQFGWPFTLRLTRMLQSPGQRRPQHTHRARNVKLRLLYIQELPGEEDFGELQCTVSGRVLQCPEPSELCPSCDPRQH